MTLMSQDELEQVALQVSNLIPFLGLLQGVFSVLSKYMKNALKLSFDLSLPDIFCLFLWLTEYKVNRLANCCYIL